MFGWDLFTRGRVGVIKVMSGKGNECETMGEYLGCLRFSEDWHVWGCRNTIGRVGNRVLDKLVRAGRTQTTPPAISMFLLLLPPHPRWSSSSS